MGRQRDLLKGRVKRMLKDDKDMGQVSEQALHCFVAALESFVRDVGTRMSNEAKKTQAPALTPVEFKRTVESTPHFAFLTDKVASIDESDVKYHHHKNQKRKRKAKNDASPPTTTGKASKKKAKVTTEDIPSSDVVIEQPLDTLKPPPAEKTTFAIEEDDDYDESEDEQ